MGLWQFWVSLAVKLMSEVLHTKLRLERQSRDTKPSDSLRT